jgi:methylmalonyl-CoA mutase cobalamin-binding subunit
MMAQWKPYPLFSGRMRSNRDSGIPSCSNGVPSVVFPESKNIMRPVALVQKDGNHIEAKMDKTGHVLLKRIEDILTTWQETGVPARATLHQIADDLLTWRIAQGIAGLWETPPLMVGATLDDGWGHGIHLILKYAKAMGVQAKFIGLLQSWEKIVAACREHSPDFLGITVLQLDTEDDLVNLRKHLPENIQIIAGGPVFSIDPEMAERVGIDWVAKDAGAFMRLLMKSVKTL